jgi:hypothetical protein
MKKILTTIAILSLLNLCKPVLKDRIIYGSESNDNLTLDIREINYIKDNKMNLCFAYITQRSYGFYYNISFTEVNCKSINF